MVPHSMQVLLCTRLQYHRLTSFVCWSNRNKEADTRVSTLSVQQFPAHIEYRKHSRQVGIASWPCWFWIPVCCNKLLTRSPRTVMHSSHSVLRNLTCRCSTCENIQASASQYMLSDMGERCTFYRYANISHVRSMYTTGLNVLLKDKHT